MGIFLPKVVAAAVLWGVGGLATQAFATPVSLIPGNTVTAGGVEITVDSCNLLINGSPPLMGCGALGGLEISATASPGAHGAPPTITAVIQNTSGAILSGNANTLASGASYDLQFDLTVETLSGASTLHSAALAMDSSAVTGTEAGRIGAGETVIAGADTLPTMHVGGSSPTGVTSTAISFGGENEITVRKDITLSTKMFGSSGNGSWTLGDAMSVNSITQVYAQAPEPTTFAVLLTGLVAFGVVRRRNRASP